MNSAEDSVNDVQHVLVQPRGTNKKLKAKLRMPRLTCSSIRRNHKHICRKCSRQHLLSCKRKRTALRIRWRDTALTSGVLEQTEHPELDEF